MLNFLTKVNENNRLSSTALAISVLCIGCYLATHANNDERILYVGLGLIVVMGMLAIDAYYSAKMKEHYEAIIKHHDKMLNDSRNENKQNRNLISGTLKTGNQGKKEGDYKELVDGE